MAENKKKDTSHNHIDFSLSEYHEDTKEYVTEKQLNNYRDDEKNISIEKQLDKNRKNNAERITERAFDEGKSMYGNKYRNEDAYSGHINKLEEKRLANKPVEKEKYESASSIPKKLRWWQVKTDDGLKIASNKTSKNYKFAANLFNGEDVKVMDSKHSGNKIVSLRLAYNPNRFNNMPEAYDAIISKIAQVVGKTPSNDDIYTGTSNDVDYLPLDLEGDKPEDWDLYKDTHSNKEGLDNEMDFPVDELEIQFKEINFEQDDIGGTPMIHGQLSFDSALYSPEKKDYIIDLAIKFIKDIRNVNITDSNIDDSEIHNGIIKFIKSDNITANINSNVKIASKKK